MYSQQGDIDVSTQQLCDFTSKLINRKYSTEQVAVIWHEVGKILFLFDCFFFMFCVRKCD
jgi:hypothetical protein